MCSPTYKFKKVLHLSTKSENVGVHYISTASNAVAQVVSWRLNLIHCKAAWNAITFPDKPMIPPSSLIRQLPKGHIGTLEVR